MSTPAPKKVPAHIIQHLRAHVDFIVRSSDAYDEGRQGEVTRFATSLRALLHDALPFVSLLAQADGLHGNFVSSVVPRGVEHGGKYGGLIRTARLDGRPIYFAPLDTAWFARWMPFSEWWNEPVFTNEEKAELSRRDLVLSVASKDGGENVDPNLTGVYTFLSQHESLGWKPPAGGGELTIPERAAIRQVVHETLKTLLPPYRKAPKIDPDQRLTNAMIKAIERPAGMPASQIFHRNEVCPCGSGKRFKVCHGQM